MEEHTPQMELNTPEFEPINLLTLSPEVICYIFQNETIQTLQLMRKICKYTRVVLTDLYQKKDAIETKRKLEASVFTSKLFFPKSISEATMTDEEVLYPDGYTQKLVFCGIEIGNIRFQNAKQQFGGNILPSYWCGYLKVPDSLFQAFVDWEQSRPQSKLPDAWEEFRDEVNVKTKFTIPEITFYQGDELGWDHAHYYDRDHYTNKADVLEEVHSFWCAMKRFWKY
ncbi:putative ORFan [Tupanvirus deep ocean]|uniref:ORFan n=2 Tax=Tupanvirus TaxID=2094720 RepID=A0AC62A9S0_9VIRU|nr:putative ORFan [Tupanvirus deep ocean]QKU34422.1 putative ORFan [Tupanvirus deep ocean]